MLALRKAEQDFEVRMKELDISEDQLSFADVADARAREIALKDKMPAVLAVLAWAQWAFIVAVLFYGDELSIVSTPEQRSILMFVLATTQALVVGAFAYYHGSSKGSRMKDDAIERLTEK